MLVLVHTPKRRASTRANLRGAVILDRNTQSFALMLYVRDVRPTTHVMESRVGCTATAPPGAACVRVVHTLATLAKPKSRALKTGAVCTEAAAPGAALASTATSAHSAR